MASFFGESALTTNIPVPHTEKFSKKGENILKMVGEIDNRNKSTSILQEQLLQQTAFCKEPQTPITSSSDDIDDCELTPNKPANEKQNTTSSQEEHQLQTKASEEEPKSQMVFGPPAFGDFHALNLTPVPANEEPNTTSSQQEQQLHLTASDEERQTSITSSLDDIHIFESTPSLPANEEQNTTSPQQEHQLQPTASDEESKPQVACGPTAFGDLDLIPVPLDEEESTALGELGEPVSSPSIPVVPPRAEVPKRGLWNCCACLQKEPKLASYAQPYGTWRKIKMASDNRAGSISKSVQKHAGRAKERILQNLGKADRTTDDILNIYISNFNKQHASAQRLSKEFKNYVSCARAMQAASKSLMDTLTDTYEQNWAGCDQLPAKTQTLEMVWDDFCHKLNDQVGVPIATYLSQFPEIRGKIAKRGRKLVDYDKCRHNLQSLQLPNRKREEMKIGKAKERLDEARKLYEVINNELHDELPALYDSRISFLATNLQTMFVSESQFHNENAKVCHQLTDVVENLAQENQKGKYRLRKPGSPLILKGDGDTRHYEEIEFKRNQGRISGQSLSNGEIISSNTLNRSDPKMRDINLNVSQTNTLNENSSMDQMRLPRKMEKDYEPVEVNEMNQSDSPIQKMDELYDIPVGATTVDLPSGVLYRVRATYKYTGEDVDELSFEIGDIIQVVEYDDPEEQEEGWLMGTKETTGEKGLFPANFTRPI